MNAGVKRKAPSFSNFDLNGHFYEYGWLIFLKLSQMDTLTAKR